MHTNNVASRLVNRAGRAGAGLGALTLGSVALAQIPAGDIRVKLQPVAGGLTAPTSLTHANDNSGRLFVVDQAGLIRVIDAGGALLPNPFLDLRPLLPALNPGFDERGLLGLAFHPQYATNGRFFVRYSRPRTGVAGEPCFGTPRGCHEELLSEFRVSAADANAADATSEAVLFRVNKPQFNHNAGGVHSGEDGFLYFSLGDGGGANDGLADVPPSHGPGGNAQNIEVPLGKMLRVDVSTPGVIAAPADNPFFGATPGLDIVWAYGLRNPFSWSFDDFGPGHTHALILGDVGQNLFEEVDIIVRGGNYGWPIREGAHCFDPFAPMTVPATCNTAGLIDPIAEYGRVDGISVIGGHVYRGSRFPGLVGRYVMGDFSTAFNAPDGHLYYMTFDPAATGLRPLSRFRLGAADAPLGLFVKGMGRDAAGELYVLGSTVLGPTGASGVVLRIARCPSDANGTGQVDVSDIFVFLSLWFAQGPGSDFDGLNGTDVADIFAFLSAWFSGC